jgi:hypothetical protein
MNLLRSYGAYTSVNLDGQPTYACVPSYPRQCAKRDPQCAKNIGTLEIVSMVK